MGLALITVSLWFVCIARGSLREQCEAPVGGLDIGHEEQLLPVTPPDLFPPLPKKFGLLGAGATSLSFQFYEPCTPERCHPICWYFKKETDSSWQSYLQTSTDRIHKAKKLMTWVTLEKLQPDSLYHVYSRAVINVEGTEETATCPPPSNSSCDNSVHTWTCEENVPGVQNLTVHVNIVGGVVLSWLPPKSKCTTLFEYQVVQLSELVESNASSAGLFWSNATDTVVGPTKPCVAYPERHCHIVWSTSEQAFHVQVLRRQDGALSKPVETYRRNPPLGPGPPRDLEVVAERPQSLVLRWRLPLVPGGRLVHALVTVSTDAGAYVRNHTVCVRGQALMTYEITGLRPGRLFNVSVRFNSNNIVGEPASVQGITAYEKQRASSRLNTSMTMGKPLPTNTHYTISSDNPFAGPSPREQQQPKSTGNATSPKESLFRNKGNHARAITDATPLSTSRPTFLPKKIMNFTEAKDQRLYNNVNTTEKSKASCIAVPNSLPKTGRPFNPSWKFITILGIVLFALAITSFIAGFCCGRQAVHSQDLRSNKSIFLGCCGENSDAYDAAGVRFGGGGGGGGRWALSHTRVRGSFPEYEELNPWRRAWGRGRPHNQVATLESSTSRSTGCSEYFFQGRLHRLPSAGYSAASALGLPLLHASYQYNPAFDPHEYEDVTHPPPYEVTKSKNRIAQRGMQPLNPAELLDAQMTSDQESSSISATRVARERTF